MILAENIPYVIEINAIPGFTTHSLLPKAAARAGIDMSQLCLRIIKSALQRAAN
jgi:D-alanine-D-alanine ligase